MTTQPFSLRKLGLTIAFAAPLALATLASPYAADAKVGCTTTKERGITTTTCTKGSHGTFDSHHGAPHSSGKDTGGGSCKVTGSDHTC